MIGQKDSSGEGISSTKLRLKMFVIFLVQLIVLLFYDVCLVPWPHMFYFILLFTIARYGLFVLKVPLNTN